MKVNKKLVIRSAKDMGINLVAALFIGLAVRNFASANDFPMSGINGIMLLLHHFFGTPLGLGSLLLNIPIIAICWRFLSKKFVFKSIATLITIALVVDLVCPLIPSYTGDKMLAAVCAGTLSGIGAAMIFANNSSGGGLDFVTMSIKSRRPHFSVGSITFTVAAVIITVSGICYHDFTGIIYGAIVQFISAMIMDKVLYSMHEGKLMLIISDRTNQIAAAINREAARSSTLINATGSYTGQDSDILLCACSNREMYEIREQINEIDDRAFTIILNSREVVGKGFLKK